VICDTSFEAGTICVVSMRGLDREDVGARAHRHHDLFERGVAGALAEAVDRALDLARAGQHRGERVGHGQAEVVVAMHRPHHLVGVGHALDQLAHGGGELDSGML
jgi:O-acetyl-ADP-ribose deacetylase (regulator of RNase III)